MAIWVLLFHILGPMITCYIIWSFLAAKLPTSTTTISILVAPVVGVMSSAWLLEEALSWQKVYSLGSDSFIYFFCHANQWLKEWIILPLNLKWFLSSWNSYSKIGF